MGTGKEALLEALAKAIEAHLVAHPLATDSASGVAKWWLDAPPAAVGVDDVEAALGLLVERSVLRRLTLADGSVLYAAARMTRQ